MQNNDLKLNVVEECIIFLYIQHADLVFRNVLVFNCARENNTYRVHIVQFENKPDIFQETDTPCRYITTPLSRTYLKLIITFFRPLITFYIKQSLI